MLRTALADAVAVDHHGFRIRSREVSRLEGLSDAVFGQPAAMYAHAWRRRVRLQLDEAEVLLTRSNLRYYAIWIGIAVFSIALSHVGGPEWVPLAGMSYGLLGPLQAINGYVVGKRVSRMRESQALVSVEVLAG